jgi:chromosome segregation and condensation protein ScpB
MTRATDDSEAPDPRVARRVLEAGGEIAIHGPVGVTRTETSVSMQEFKGRWVRKLADLPTEPYRITRIICQENKAVTDETLAEVSGLQLLDVLGVSTTSVTEAAIEKIVRTPNLRELGLVFIPLSSAAIAKHTTKSSLQAVRLPSTNLDGASAQHLGQLTNLVTLDAYNQPVTDEALRHIRGHATLQFLHVNGDASQVSDEGLRHVATLRSLRDLAVSHCRRITDAGLAALADLPALETLHLNATPITDASLPHLHKLKTLKSLNLTETAVTPAAIDTLQDTLPWCRIQGPKLP